MTSVQSFARNFKSSERPLDVLICNAGINGDTAKYEAISTQQRVVLCAATLAMQTCTASTELNVSVFCRTLKNQLTSDGFNHLFQVLLLFTYTRVKRCATDRWTGVLQVNHLGHFLLIQLLLHPLMQSGHGRVVSLSSVSMHTIAHASNS